MRVKVKPQLDRVGLGWLESVDLTLLSPPLPSPRLLPAVLHARDPSDLCGWQWPSWLLHSPAPVKGRPSLAIHFLPQFCG